MSGRCSGKCCTSIVLKNRESIDLGLPCVPRSWMRCFIDRDESIEAAKIWSLLRLEHVREDGADVHRCVALGAGGCVLDRSDRPNMCNDFPYGGDPCKDCGACSDAEARGVALQRSW